MSAITYGNGIAGTISYDNQYRITFISAGSVLNLNYSGYDNNGNITAITNVLDNTKNKTFTYDALDRLSTAASTGIWGNLAWTYDGVGNRLTENSNNYTYVTNSNKLSTANGLSYSYDNNGNTTAEGAKAYTFNQNQRLIQVVDGSMTAGYIYNGNGQRVKKVVNGTTTVFHYGMSGQIIAESDAAGNITAEYVYLNGQPLAKIEGTNTYYYHNNHLATSQKMTDATGAVVWSADYKPFGEANVTVSTITNNLRFPGQYFDAETGLNYNYFRDYNPVTGRYVQKDPIGLLGGLNLYAYVRNNPVNWIDPLGLRITNLTTEEIRVKLGVGNNNYRTLEPGQHEDSADGVVVGDTVVKVNDGVNVTIVDDSGNLYVHYDAPSDLFIDFTTNVLKLMGIPEWFGRNTDLSGYYDYDEWVKDHSDWIDLLRTKKCH